MSSRPGSQRPVHPPLVQRLWAGTMQHFGLASERPLDEMQRLCLALIDGLPPAQRHALVSQIAHLKSLHDLRGLKPRLYEAVCLHLGEREARRRLDRLEGRAP